MLERRHCAELGGECPANALKEPDPDGAFRCPMHSTAPDVVARRATWRSRGGQNTLRALPANTELPSFDNRDNIVAFAEERAHMVETGQLDPRLSAESRG